MIQLKSVSKVYRVGPVKVTALDGVSLEIEKGEFTVLAGPSGSGKTTLLRLLYRDEVPTEGEIRVAGFDVTGMRRSRIPHLRRAVGGVFQDAKLLPARNVYDNVVFVPRGAMAEYILSLLSDIWTRGTTILLATHRATLANQLKRRTLVLDGGRLLKGEA